MSETIKPASEGQPHNIAETEAQPDSIIDQIKILPDIAEIKQDFIEQRLSQLGENPIRKLEKMDQFFSPITGNFFDKTMRIQPGVNTEASFTVDDDQIYSDSIKNLQSFDEKFPTMNPYRLALRTAQETTTQYFGNLVPSPEQQQIRHEKFDTPSSEEHIYSIADERHSALCAERAAVAHDILQFLGQESYYVGGKLNEQSSDHETSELHSYVIIKNPDTEHYEIFDPMNPVHCYGDEDLTKLQAFLPYTVDTGSDQLPSRGDEFSAPCAVNYKDTLGNKQSKVTKHRTYKIGG